MSHEELTSRQVQEVGELLRPAFENSVRVILDEKLDDIYKRLRVVEEFQIRATVIGGGIVMLVDWLLRLLVK